MFMLGGAREVIDTSMPPPPALALAGDEGAVTAVRGALTARRDPISQDDFVLPGQPLDQLRGGLGLRHGGP
jgi:hypothetical protein